MAKGLTSMGYSITDATAKAMLYSIDSLAQVTGESVVKRVRETGGKAFYEMNNREVAKQILKNLRGGYNAAGFVDRERGKGGAVRRRQAEARIVERSDQEPPEASGRPQKGCMSCNLSVVWEAGDAESVRGARPGRHGLCRARRDLEVVDHLVDGEGIGDAVSVSDRANTTPATRAVGQHERPARVAGPHGALQDVDRAGGEVAVVDARPRASVASSTAAPDAVRPPPPG